MKYLPSFPNEILLTNEVLFMFQPEELARLDTGYFIIIRKTADCVTLRSKNTRHYWHILHQEYPTFKSCIIYHNHREGADYHTHGHAPTLDDAISLIIEHDHFQLNGRNRQKKPAVLRFKNMK